MKLQSMLQSKLLQVIRNRWYEGLRIDRDLFRPIAF